MHVMYDTLRFWLVISGVFGKGFGLRVMVGFSFADNIVEIKAIFKRSI